MIKKLVGITSSTLLLYCTYLWTVNGVEWAENLVKFYLILALVCELLIAFSTDAKHRAYSKGRSTPKPLAYVLYATLIGLLAAQGEFVFATVATLSVFLEVNIYDVT